MADSTSPEWGTGAPVFPTLFAPDSPIFEGATVRTNIGYGWMPAEYTSARDEFLATRESASIGFSLNVSPVYDVSGPDAVAFFDSVAVNKTFATLEEGASKHVVLCNDDGYMLADGVVIKIGENRYRTYWLAPVLDFFLRTSGLDVEGTWVADEFFFQIDGPKSLEILEGVTGSDLRGLAFARNTSAEIDGHPVTIHRLGMSGALAYEVHGHSSHVIDTYKTLRAAVEAAGGRPQGFWNYSILNHTVAGYPNQFLHFIYPYRDSGAELSSFLDQVGIFDLNVVGSAADVKSNAWKTPYDVGWGYLVNFDHEFRGKEALRRIAADRPTKVVTLEWNAEDIGEVVASQFRGDESQMYDQMSNDPVTSIQDWQNTRLRLDYVLADGKKIGVTSGRSPAFLEKRMISLAFIDKEYAAEGTELTVLWGGLDSPKIEIRARVAQFPYYRGPLRNEKLDTTAL
jgi:glycine cleavage system aminomethyltransferase T